MLNYFCQDFSNYKIIKNQKLEEAKTDSCSGAVDVAILIAIAIGEASYFGSWIWANPKYGMPWLEWLQEM